MICSASAVYPRLRGERWISRPLREYYSGLSPATRGTPALACRFSCHRRFIPGYAGNASGLIDQFRADSVYPRLRGERMWPVLITPSHHGLSPATRGTPAVNLTAADSWRFIPGYAGNASGKFRFQGFEPVYPRLRGERFLIKIAHVVYLGLSPATRGTHRIVLTRKMLTRFIPGYAGNAANASLVSIANTVYPRLRGERRVSFRVCHPYFGLSPATRGTLLIAGVVVAFWRFIPGYAGNALNNKVNNPVDAVYPRLRGERSS